MMKLALNAVPSVWKQIAALRHREMSLLAPRMQTSVGAALDACHVHPGIWIDNGDGSTSVIPLDVVLNETLRSDELQAIYYAQGTTHAKTARLSWHFYGLAVDVISEAFEWFDGAAARARWPRASERSAIAARWFAAVAEVFSRYGLDWGGHWHDPDFPHFQWYHCSASPHLAPSIYDAAGGGTPGREAVWRAVGAAA